MTDNTFALSTISAPTGLAAGNSFYGKLQTRLAERANLTVLREAGQEAMREQCRAMLTHTALENTAMLSALEAHCYRTAPLGEERYKQIVDAYALSAARRIVRW